KDIFAGKVRTVVCWKLDRISRRMRDGINTLGDWFQRGLKFVSVTQAIELNGALGNMIAALMFGLAEIEREHIRERQEAGIAAYRKAGGKYPGRQAGNTKVKDVGRAMELRNRGLTIPEIANAMGVSTASVSRYIRATA